MRLDACRAFSVGEKRKGHSAHADAIPCPGADRDLPFQGALTHFFRWPEGGAGGNGGKTQGGLLLGNPVCLWQTELFKLNLKSSPSSSGYNRRRRLATRSSGKQQAGRTAVRTAPIVCPEESPLLAAIDDNFAVINSPWRGLTRRLRRELGLAVPWGAHTFLSVAKEKCAKESQRHGDSGKKPFIAHF